MMTNTFSTTTSTTTTTTEVSTMSYWWTTAHWILPQRLLLGPYFSVAAVLHQHWPSVPSWMSNHHAYSSFSLSAELPPMPAVGIVSVLDSQLMRTLTDELRVYRTKNLPVNDRWADWWHTIEMDDKEDQPLLNRLPAVIAFILRQWNDFHRPVLIHCAAGVSRSATLVIGFLMKWMEWTFQESHWWVQQCRPCIAPNPGFLRQLQSDDCLKI